MTNRPSAAPATAPWRHPPLLRWSAGLHVVAAAGCVALPSAWPWAAGTLVADHLAIVAAGLWPRSTVLGPNRLRLPVDAAARGEIALTFDDGPDPEVTPRVLDLLDAHRARASFFCIARHAASYPALCREIVRRGHRVENHSLRHPNHFSLMGPAAIRREVGEAQRRLTEAAGVSPRWFRAPAGLRNLFLGPVLHELGLESVAWTRRGFDTVRTDPYRVAARLGRGLKAGDILLLHDRHAARAADGRPVVLGALERLLPRLGDRHLRAVALPAA